MFCPTIHHVIPSLVGIEHHLHSSPKPPLAPFPENFQTQTLALLEKRFGFVVRDPVLLAAASLSPHGLKWLHNARGKALKFGSYDEVLNIIKDFIHVCVDEVSKWSTSDHSAIRGNEASTMNQE